MDHLILSFLFVTFSYGISKYHFVFKLKMKQDLCKSVLDVVFLLLNVLCDAHMIDYISVRKTRN